MFRVRVPFLYFWFLLFIWAIISNYISGDITFYYIRSYDKYGKEFQVISKQIVSIVSFFTQ